MHTIQNPEPKSLDAVISDLEAITDPLYAKFPRSDGQWLALLAAPTDAPDTDAIFEQFIGHSKQAGLTLVVADVVRDATSLRRRAHRVRVARGGRVVHDAPLATAVLGAELRKWWHEQPAFGEILS